MKKINVLIAVIIALGSASAVIARDRNEDAIAARKAAFTLIAANFGPMGAMAKKKIPFDKDEFAKRAANVEMLSDMPWEFFIKGSDEGDTKAKPEVWRNASDYEKKADQFRKEVAKLAQFSKTGDKKAMFAQFGKTAKTCKSCHKEYKEKN
jgi:cytochrome c556